MDARRPFTELDIQMLEWFAPTGKPVHCLLTKADKLNRSEAANALRQAQTVLASYVDEAGQPFPFTVQLFSSLKRIGLEEADRRILELVGLGTGPGRIKWEYVLKISDLKTEMAHYTRSICPTASMPGFSSGANSAKKTLEKGDYLQGNNA